MTRSAARRAVETGAALPRKALETGAALPRKAWEAGAAALAPAMRALPLPGLVKRAKEPGLSPGTLVHVGERRVAEPRITFFDYGPDHVDERAGASLADCLALRDRPSVTWINVDGLHHVDLVAALGKHYGVHPLALEDLLNTGQRPKVEDYGDHLFVVVKMLHVPEEGPVEVEQVSLVLGKGYVLSFQERPGDVLDPVRARLRSGKGRIREHGPDYLAYALLDTIVDHYFLALERMGERVEALEEELLRAPGPRTVAAIHGLKREALVLRRAVWPLREVASALERGDSQLIAAPTRVYLRDVYDHVIQAMDTVETLRELLAGMLDIYLSSMSHRLNEVMKMLAIIATIFIPLSFIAGIYGMNFRGMPEVEHPLGYPLVLAVMLAIALGMVWHFRRRGWM